MDINFLGVIISVIIFIFIIKKIFNLFKKDDTREQIKYIEQMETQEKIKNKFETSLTDGTFANAATSILSKVATYYAGV